MVALNLILSHRLYSQFRNTTKPKCYSLPLRTVNNILDLFDNLMVAPSGLALLLLWHSKIYMQLAGYFCLQADFGRPRLCSSWLAAAKYRRIDGCKLRMRNMPDIVR